MPFMAVDKGYVLFQLRQTSKAGPVEWEWWTSSIESLSGLYLLLTLVFPFQPAGGWVHG